MTLHHLLILLVICIHQQQLLELLFTFYTIQFQLLSSVAHFDSSGRLCQRPRKWRYRWNWNELREEPDDVFHRLFRFTKPNFLKLAELLRPFWPSETPHGGRRRLQMEQCMLMVLRRLSTTTQLDDLSNEFGAASSSIVRYTATMVDAVRKALLPHYMKWPSTPTERLALEYGFKQRAQQLGYIHMPGIVGAVDGTHIRLNQPPRRDAAAYFNRKKWPSINVLAVCDANGQFIYVNIGWPGSCHDSTVFDNSSLPQLLDEWKSSCYLIADSGFALRSTTMVQYDNDAKLTPRQEQFNETLKRNRGCIERSFGRLKQRFPRLKAMDFVGESTICRVIGMCFILHNFCESNADLWELADTPIETLLNEHDPAPHFGHAPADALRKRNALADDIFVHNL